ncbi:MFS transporter [Streptomyces cavernae]|uniref:MFS transporter n=1 Tax=Streptomyces cavernae TaxID=2259034 RepID=UPI000FEBC1BC|nr:MFS transporter [Streptomyces cavernae]
MLVLTQYLQFVEGYTPTETGLAFLPLAVASLLFNGVGAALAQKIGNRALAVGGLLVIASGFAVLATLSQGDGFGLLTAAMLLMGAGAGLAMPATTAALLGAVPEEHAGVGSALNDTIQQAGAALGVAVMGAVLFSTYTSSMPASAPAAARHSVADALATGDSSLVATAREAFTNAMSGSFLAGAAGVVAAAAVAAVLIRGGGRKGDADAADTAGSADATDSVDAADSVAVLDEGEGEFHRGSGPVPGSSSSSASRSVKEPVSGHAHAAR